MRTHRIIIGSVVEGMPLPVLGLRTLYRPTAAALLPIMPHGIITVNNMHCNNMHIVLRHAFERRNHQPFVEVI